LNLLKPSGKQKNTINSILRRPVKKAAVSKIQLNLFLENFN
jgi:hypothetical protein